MFALFSAVFRRLFPSRVRALKQPPYRSVVEIRAYRDGSEKWLLACGHTLVVNRHRRATAPCEECAWLESTGAIQRDPLDHPDVLLKSYLTSPRAETSVQRETKDVQ